MKGTIIKNKPSKVEAVVQGLEWQPGMHRDLGSGSHTLQFYTEVLSMCWGGGQWCEQAFKLYPEL